MIIDFIDKIPEFLSPWVFVPLVFLLYTLLAFSCKRLILVRLSKFANRTSSHFDDIFVSSLSTPFNIIIIAAGISFLSHFLPLTVQTNNLINIFFQCSIILCIVLFADRFLLGLLNNYQTKIQAGVSPVLLRVIVRTIVYGTAILIFLGTIGIAITPVLASLGIGSLAVGLALQETLSNFFAGIHIAFDKPVRIGDYIKLESGQEGYVTEIGWRSTRILLLTNDTVIVPNSKLTSTILTNYYLPDKEKAVVIEMSVYYQNDLEKVEQLTIETAREVMKTTAGAVTGFEPVVRFSAFSGSAVDFTVVLRGREFVDQYLLKHEFIKALNARFKKEKIRFSYVPTAAEVAPKSFDSYFDNQPKSAN